MFILYPNCRQRSFSYFCNCYSSGSQRKSNLSVFCNFFRISDFEKKAKDHSETESQTEEPTEQEKEEEKDTKTVGTQSLRLLPHSQWMEGSEGTAAKSCDVWL